MKAVLVVDDSATMRKMVMVSLADQDDVRFIQASDGLEAIERMAVEHVDIVVLDVNMPGMHGIEFLKFLRKQARYAALPVIVLTTKSEDSTHREALEAGATRYLTKPFRPAELAVQVREALDAR